MQKITPFLMFNGNVQEALDLYSSIFKESTISNVSKVEGKTQSATFELAGQKFLAFDGGPHFKFSEAISLFVDCEDQAEVDTIWNAFLDKGSTPSQCGWLTDPFGVSWQIIPKALNEYLAGSDSEGAGRALQAMLGMGKIDVEGLKKAYEGTTN